MDVKEARLHELAFAPVSEIAATQPYGAAIAHMCTPQPSHPDPARKQEKNPAQYGRIA
jgi:hypothetical protein